MRERMVNALRFEKNNTEDFWALNDVSFTVNPGESIGIIGRNGAGKSTLLKVLSKITPPTKGKIISRGRIASLLEVGTGFHPELTGRENIFFNGSLLGMKRKEIEAKFDEIVDFSGVEKFLDTPLKHYSSGMQLRLAFAVAAFLEPEILIIDEVLAVGDAEFQKKCMGKMEDVSKSGRTILFVSHNMGAVSQLCDSSILLDWGKINFIGPTKEAIARHLLSEEDGDKVDFNHTIIRSALIKQADSMLVLEVSYSSSDTKPIHMGFVMSDQYGNKICGSNPILAEQNLPEIIPSKGKIILKLSAPKLNDGVYHFSLWAGYGYGNFFHEENCLSVNVKNMANRKKQMNTSMVGVVVPEVSWEFNTN